MCVYVHGYASLFMCVFIICCVCVFVSVCNVCVSMCVCVVVLDYVISVPESVRVCICVTDCEFVCLMYYESTSVKVCVS